MRYPEADRIREERYAAIMATNAELRAEVDHQNKRLGEVRATVSALELLPTQWEVLA